MIWKKKKEEFSYFSLFYEKYKLATMATFYYISKNCICHILIYIFLQIVESVQFFLLLDHFDNFYFGDSIKFMNFFLTFNTDFNGSIAGIIFSSSVLWVIGGIYVVLSCKSYQQISEIPTEFPINMTGKLLSLFLVLLKTIFFIPMFLNFILPMSTSYSALDEKSNLNSLFMVLGILNAILLTGLCAKTTIFYNDKNPYSKIPFAKSIEAVEWIKFIKKILYCSLVISSLSTNKKMFFYIGGGILNGGALWYLKTRPSYLNKWVEGMDLVLGSGLLITCLIELLETIFEEELFTSMILRLIIYLIFLPCLLLLHMVMKESLRYKLLEIPSFILYSSSGQVEEMYFLILKSIEDKKKDTVMNTLYGYIKNHIRACDQAKCRCRELDPKKSRVILNIAKTSTMRFSSLFPTIRKKNSSTKKTFKEKTLDPNLLEKSDDEEDHELNQDKMLKEGNSNHKEDLKQNLTNDKIIFLMLKIQLQLWILSNNNPEVNLLSAYLNYFHIKNRYSSLFDLMKAEESSPSLFIQSMIFQLKKNIEVDFQIQEDRGQQNTLGNHNITKLVTYQEKYIKFHEYIQQITKLHQEFWREICKPQPSYERLIHLGSEVTQKKILIDNTKKTLNLINPNNIKGEILYCLFLKNVEGDIIGSLEIHESVKRIQATSAISRRFMEQNELKYGGSSTAAVILVSGNKSTLGKILSVNYELTQHFGYKISDVKHQNISVIMPEIIGIRHNDLILTFFQEDFKSKINTREKLFFAKHSKGYIIPALTLVRPFPNLRNGIQFLGFINLARTIDEARFGEEDIRENEVYLFILDENMNIEGFNKKFASALGQKEEINIHKYLDLPRKVNFKNYFPFLFQYENEVQMKGPNGKIADISLSKLVTAISSKIIDYQNLRRTEATSKATNESDKESDRSDDQLNIEYNIKLKEYNHRNICKYYVLTLFPFLSRKNTLLDLAVTGFEEEKQNPNLINFTPLLEDNCSSSGQSSLTSSDTEKRYVQDLKLKMRDNSSTKAIKYLKNMCIIILLLLVIINSVEFAIKRMKISNVKDVCSFALLTYDRLKIIAEIPFCLRILRNMWTQAIPFNSLIKGIDDQDRVTFYHNYVSLCCLTRFELEDITEELRIVQNQISQNKNVELISEIENSKIEVGEMNEGTCDLLDISTLTMPFYSAISKVITNLVYIIEQYSIQNILTNANFDCISDNERAVEFISRNMNIIILNLCEEATELVTEKTSDNFSSEERLLIIFTCCSCGISIIAIVLLFPQVKKTHKSIVSVFGVLTKLTREEVDELISKYDHFLSNISTHFKEIRKYYNSQDFLMEDIFRKEETKEIEAESTNMKIQKSFQFRSLEETIENKNTTENQDEEQKSEDDEDSDSDEEKQLNKKENQAYAHVDHNAVESKRKRKLIKQSSWKRGKRLSIQVIAILVLLMSISGYKIYDSISFYSKAQVTIDLLKIVCKRKPYLNSALLFEQEYLSLKFSLLSDVFWNYLNYTQENEINLFSMYRTMKNYYPDYFELCTNYDRPNICEYIPELGDYCQEDFFGIMRLGTKGSMTLLNKYLRNVMNAVELNEDADKVLYSDLFTNLTDVKVLYIDEVLSKLQEEFMEEIQDFFDYRTKLAEIVFGCYLGFLILVFMIYMRIMLINFDLFLWKAKNLLGMMPVEYIYKNVSDIKKLVQIIS